MLITLVIIGVVAALTIPTLMKKYQQHVFATQFKKSIATISQIVARTRSELGVSNLGAYCAEYDSNRGGYYNDEECRHQINEYIQKTHLKQYGNTVYYNIDRRNEIIKTYNNKNNITNFDAAVIPIFFVRQLQDGSFLGFYINGGYINFGVDLNGKKKPNRLGYDIFLVSVNKNNNDTITSLRNIRSSNVPDTNAMNLTWPLLSDSPCNLDSTRESNGIGCAYFALRNKCPYDDTKTYWECLK